MKLTQVRMSFSGSVQEKLNKSNNISATWQLRGERMNTHAQSLISDSRFRLQPLLMYVTELRVVRAEFFIHSTFSYNSSQILAL